MGQRLTLHQAGAEHTIKYLTDRINELEREINETNGHLDVVQANAHTLLSRKDKKITELESENKKLLSALENILSDLFGRINHGVSAEHMQTASEIVRNKGALHG